MTMTTHKAQCPECQYLFDITDEQLKLKKGYARCGKCKFIFSAKDHLVANKPAPVQPTPTPPKKPAKKIADGNAIFDDNAGLDMPTRKQQDKDQVVDFDIISNFDSLPSNKIGQTKSTEQDEAWLTELLEEEKRKEEAVQYMPDRDKIGKIGRENDVSFMLEGLGVDVAEDALIEEEDYRKKLDERFSQQVASQKNVKTPIGMMMVWLLGSILLIGLLLVQYTVFNLDKLLKNPESASHIQTVCGIAKCDLPVANVSMIKTDTLSLNKAKQANQSDLIFTLTNTTDKQIIYPNLKISLRDSNDIKAQTLLTPEQYLDKDSYLMPREIKAVKLRIDYPKSSYEQANIEPFY